MYLKLLYIWILCICSGIATLLPPPKTGLNSDENIKTNQDEAANEKRFKIKDDDIIKAIHFGTRTINHIKRLEQNLDSSQIVLSKGSPAFFHYLEHEPQKEAISHGRDGLGVLKASAYLINSYCQSSHLTTEQCSRDITNYKIPTSESQLMCKKNFKTCSQSDFNKEYRTIDGSCNKITESNLGKSFTTYKRLLHPNFLDGTYQIRRSVTKNSLPSARLISLAINQDDNILDENFTLAVVQWGEFIANDLSHTATSIKVHSKTTITCCNMDGSYLQPRYIHPFCVPIEVPYNDEVYSGHKVNCMSYVRSMPALNSDCNLGPFEQLNQATHFMDGSQVYGSTDNDASKLRTYTKGLLRFTTNSGQQYLPSAENQREVCPKSNYCFMAGDKRVNIHPQLTAMHTIWLREHNRIARQLSDINTQWNDEKIYQEARKIVIAEIQHITFYEWLPIILGKKLTSLIWETKTKPQEYDASVSNSFATAVSQFIKSLKSETIDLYEGSRIMSGSEPAKDYYNNPSLLMKANNFDDILRGLATQRAHKFDNNFASHVTSHMHSAGNIGLDSLSLDIQRGRDHGLPSYNEFRKVCGLKEAVTFQDFSDSISSEKIRSLANIYKDPRDVDLIIGGFMEKPVGDALVGPTFACIYGDQMLRTKNGDRYFYSNKDQPTPFTDSQVKEIEKVTLAKIFCENSNSIQDMQPNIFKLISSSNELMSCSKLPEVNLRIWSASN